MNTLVIVESPSKVPTIKGFLGKGYKVVACKGHLRDLPKSKLGIDIENDFKPQYINIRGKGDIINSLRKEAKNADRVILATDPDREGEAMSWHLAAVLGLEGDKVKRISFNEITKNTFKEAVKNQRDLDMNLVDSQQARRILDRIVGYKISPFLWKKIKNGLSAGRVQSVATRIIVEREEEIKAFVPAEYWTITAKLLTEKGVSVNAKFYGDKSGKIDLTNEEQVGKIINAIENHIFTVDEIKKSVKTRRPQPPFTTSTLQQEANRRLSFQSQRTMMIAQELYEGVNIGEKGTHGLITYMRTDSLRVSDEARDAAKAFINEKYGDSYYPKEPNVYKTKKNSQDAHEAVRPSDPRISPDSIKGRLSADQYKLYKLIWERFIASQMSSALIDSVVCDFNSQGYIFRSSGETIKFLGYKALYEDITEDNEESNGDGKSKLLELNVGEKLDKESIIPEQHFTQPPSRFTEGSLIKMLEEKGIGRPSTYSPTITTIISRGYIKREGKVLVPTELGFVTTELMKKSFAHIVDYNFTAKMEEDLDRVESGIADYISILKEFYGDFEKQLLEAEKNLSDMKIELTKVETDIICDKCGARMIEKAGRFGKFAACPNYPACKNTSRLDGAGEKGSGDDSAAKEVIADEKCRNCGEDMVLRRGAFGNFYACRNYPTCKTSIPFYKDSGILCPDCGKRILVKQTKSKKTYFSCESYPECSFSVWDIPQERVCPDCKGLVLKKKNKEYYYCKNQCGWSEGKK
ncbi:MAG: type I DNA topoisomerase [Firmicutes bacterium HGW-Firmicutes-21]|nr:MAG: type I DNA topoisomerase [Firmicutes bacterium HGW-Firmicutes-21]